MVNMAKRRAYTKYLQQATRILKRDNRQILRRKISDEDTPFEPIKGTSVLATLFDASSVARSVKRIRDLVEIGQLAYQDYEYRLKELS